MSCVESEEDMNEKYCQVPEFLGSSHEGDNVIRSGISSYSEKSDHIDPSSFFKNPTDRIVTVMEGKKGEGSCVFTELVNKNTNPMEVLFLRNNSLGATDLVVEIKDEYSQNPDSDKSHRKRQMRECFRNSHTQNEIHRLSQVPKKLDEDVYEKFVKLISKRTSGGKDSVNWNPEYGVNEFPNCSISVIRETNRNNHRNHYVDHGKKRYFLSIQSTFPSARRTLERMIREGRFTSMNQMRDSMKNFEDLCKRNVMRIAYRLACNMGVGIEHKQDTKCHSKTGSMIVNQCVPLLCQTHSGIDYTFRKDDSVLCHSHAIPVEKMSEKEKNRPMMLLRGGQHCPGVIITGHQKHKNYHVEETKKHHKNINTLVNMINDSKTKSELKYLHDDTEEKKHHQKMNTNYPKPPQSIRINEKVQSSDFNSSIFSMLRVLPTYRETSYRIINSVDKPKLNQKTSNVIIFVKDPKETHKWKTHTNPAVHRIKPCSRNTHKGIIKPMFVNQVLDQSKWFEGSTHSHHKNPHKTNESYLLPNEERTNQKNRIYFKPICSVRHHQ